ncbi:MAG: peptide-methionine (S)-S-oxide reductase MsrA [Rhodopseudomonas palustris]|nr:peptide-methionine (S)-S-oxide reductase MsrA [Rhodopseudomonas palustris]
MFFSRKKSTLPTADEALPGRSTPLPIAPSHAVLRRPLAPPYPQGLQRAVFGLGCFWGAERKFWQLGDGIHVTAVGYAGGHTPNPTYEEVCSGSTGHTEVVLVVFDPGRISFDRLLQTFWESHDPTQGMRQGNDVGTQYRSGDLHRRRRAARGRQASRDAYQQRLGGARLRHRSPPRFRRRTEFYFAEDYHQQYLAKNPGGYCWARRHRRQLVRSG